MITYLENQVRSHDIQVELGVEIGNEWLDRVKPDVAILATGSDPAFPSITGLSKEKTVTGRNALTVGGVQGDRVVVIGGGRVGCEVAEFLSEQGKEITIVEMMDDIAGDMPHIPKLPLEMALEKNGVRIMTKTTVQSVTDESVRVAWKGEEENLLADTIVIATGAEPHLDIIDDLIKEKVAEVYSVGDRLKPRGILDAVQEGYNIAKEI